MPDTLTDSSAFIPQTVTPPEKPLPLVRGLLQMIANPLHVWPQAMYENPYHGVRWIGRTFHYFRRPEHMKAMLSSPPNCHVWRTGTNSSITILGRLAV